MLNQFKPWINKKIIQELHDDAITIYKIQLVRLNIISSFFITKNKFESAMKQLFETNLQIFLNCGKQCQHLIQLWKLSLHDKILNLLTELGLKHISISRIYFHVYKIIF